MKYSLRYCQHRSFLVFLCLPASIPTPQIPALEFGKAVILKDITPTAQGKDIPLKWINVNTDESTWERQKGILICSGKPIGVMRSEKQYENFILHIEWMHIEPGGNSGVFVWSKANPAEESRLPDGVEVQMLELDWINLNIKDGVTPPVCICSR